MPDPSPRSIDAIVDEQIRRWRLAQRERQKKERPPLPLITVSREFGSLGAAIGQAAATKLGFAFWDQQLVHEVADRSGAPQRLVESLDERARSHLDDLIMSALSGYRSTEFHYVRQLYRVVGTIRQHGAAVVIGRGAQFILEPNECLRVRVICPLEERAAAYAEREGLSVDRARAKVEKTERERRDFIRLSFDRDVTDENHYDLIVNSCQFTTDAAADVVVAGYEAKFADVLERSGRTVGAAE